MTANRTRPKGSTHSIRKQYSGNEKNASEWFPITLSAIRDRSYRTDVAERDREAYGVSQMQVSA